MREAGAEVLVLGCAGMTGLQRTVGEKLGLPVVDGVGAAVKLAESLVGLGLNTSRAGGYAKPVPKRRVWGRGRTDGVRGGTLQGRHTYRTSGSRSSLPLPSVRPASTKP